MKCARSSARPIAWKSAWKATRTNGNKDLRKELRQARDEPGGV